jgi:iron-sulfur cluster repair protein YtfE (RIC family)
MKELMSDTIELIDEITRQHHEPLKAALPALYEALSGAPNLQRVFGELRMLLTDHLMKEEVILFPMITALARSGSTEGCGLMGPIRQMRHEHTRIRGLEEELRRRSAEAGPAEASLIALLDDLLVHARKEDENLFPAAFVLAGLPEPDWDDEPVSTLPTSPPRLAPSPSPAPSTSDPRPSLLRRIARRVRKPHR